MAQRATLDNPAAPTGLSYQDAERFEKLERVIALLPAEMQEAVLLRRVEGLSNHETAQMLGKTPEATSKLYNRALARLGSILKAAP